jgi:hypothetical protein
MPTRTSRTLSRSSFLLFACLVAGVVRIPAKSRAEEEGPRLRVTVFLVWASDGDSKDKAPKELEKIEEQLRKTLKKNCFLLESRPVEQVLRSGQALSVKIPQGYEVRWTFERGEDRKPVLRQSLVNPAKKESVNILKKSPAITHIEKIKSGTATFLLCVQFEEVLDAKP